MQYLLIREIVASASFLTLRASQVPAIVDLLSDTSSFLVNAAIEALGCLRAHIPEEHVEAVFQRLQRPEPERTAPRVTPRADSDQP